MDITVSNEKMFFDAGSDMMLDHNIQRLDTDCLNEFEEKEQIIRYLVLMYGKGSVFYTNYKDIQDRHFAALEHCGLSDFRKKELLLSLGIHGLPRLIHSMLQLQGDRVWKMIRLNETFLFELEYNVLRPINEEKDSHQMSALEKKAKILETMDVLHSRLNGLEEVFYKSASANSEKVKAVRFTPEAMAEMLR